MEQPGGPIQTRNEEADDRRTGPKPFVFVLMPFAVEFDDTYQLGIKAAAAEAGAHCQRVDEQIFEEDMLDRIFNQIAKADILVADMTGKNPNVFYEVGYAHALDKRVVLLTRNDEDIPFDLRHRYHIVYGSIGELKRELTRRLRYYVQNPHVDGSLQSSLGFSLNGVRLRDGRPIKVHNREGSVVLVAENDPLNSPGSVECRLALIAPGPDSIYVPAGVRGRYGCRLANGDYLFFLTEMELIHPGSVVQAGFRVRLEKNANDMALRLRIVKQGACEEYPFTVRVEDDAPETKGEDVL